MKRFTILGLALAANLAHAQVRQAARADDPRAEAEYYVAAYSQHYRISPELVRAVIFQESDWNPRAISTKGAKGYMQLMPRTAAEYGVSDPFDASQNIGGGTHFLADLFQEFHGELRLVLAAYYCGSRWISAKGLGYSNPDVYKYVARIRKRYEEEMQKSMLAARMAGEKQDNEVNLEAKVNQERQQ